MCHNNKNFVHFWLLSLFPFNCFGVIFFFLSLFPYFLWIYLTNGIQKKRKKEIAWFAATTVCKEIFIHYVWHIRIKPYRSYETFLFIQGFSQVYTCIVFVYLNIRPKLQIISSFMLWHDYYFVVVFFIQFSEIKFQWKPQKQY